jgi:hypothetical protein
MQSVGASALPEGGEAGLPRSWMQSQWKLQKFILNLTRPLGIIGVLPAFQGNLPPQIKTLQPKANISVTRHSDVSNFRCSCSSVPNPASANPLVSMGV